MLEFTENRDINLFLNKILEEVKEFTEEQLKHIKKLNEIGIALSAENDLDKLLDLILHQAKKFTNADGGTLYLKSSDGERLYFKVVETDSLNIKMGGTGSDITWPALELHKSTGESNSKMVATYCAMSGEVINIEDVYDVEGFNFEGTKKFDSGTGYRSKSMLVIPMRNYEKEIIGVLQLLNRQDNQTKEVIAFSKDDQDLTLSLASQAAVAITNTKLVQELETLLNAMIKTIASAIDEKSPYTGGHIRRVAKVTTMLADAINSSNDKKFKKLKYDKEDLRVLKISAWMHDIGKITTPEFIMDKSTKLETIHDRIEGVRAKFEIAKRDVEIEFLKLKLKALERGEDIGDLGDALKEEIEKLDSDLEFIEKCNIGGEFMADDKIERVKTIAKTKIKIKSDTINILTQNEIDNLSIRKGTLTDAEREKIQDHASMTIKMLEQLPFPKKLSRVPEIAGNHHEKINGKGYPRGIGGDELSIEARILAVADIFEALTAPDRPYKVPMKLSQVAKIMGFMIKDGELDKDLVKLFFDNNLHLEYAKDELKDEQIDEFEVNF